MDMYFFSLSPSKIAKRLLYNCNEGFIKVWRDLRKSYLLKAHSEGTQKSTFQWFFEILMTIIYFFIKMCEMYFLISLSPSRPW